MFSREAFAEGIDASALGEAGVCLSVVEVLGLSRLDDFGVAFGMISRAGRADGSALSFFSNRAIALCRSFVC